MGSPHIATARTNPSLFASRVLGVTPHPGQIEWLNCRARVKVACCGRRWGKTYSTAADLIWFAVMHPGTTQFLVAPTHDQVTILFRYVEKMLRESEIATAVLKVVYSPFPEITLDNGSQIKARSAGNDASNLRGHGADRIILDEAAFIPDAVYETISPLLATSKYGELVLISTPFGKNTFFDYWQRGQGEDAAVQSFRYPSSSNPHLSRAYLEQQRRDMTRMAYATEYDAEFNEDQATVFKWSLIQACRDADITRPDPVPANHRYVLGYDPAKWVDRSGVVVMDITAKPWQAVEVLDIAGRDYLAQAPIVKQLVTRYNRATVLLDTTSHDQLLEQLKLDGINAEGYQFTNASKQELINGLVIAMEQGRVIFPDHVDLLRELSYYRFELTAAGNVKLGAPDKPGHHDDLVTALALAVQQATNGAALPYAYLRDDPAFRAAVLGPDTPLTEDERIAKRIADYRASIGG